MNDGDNTNENDFLSDLSFSPQWAKQDAGSHYERPAGRPERPAPGGDGDRGAPRRERGDRPFRRDRPPFRRDRPPREDGEGRPPFRRDRPPREDGEGRPPFRRDRPPREDGEGRPPFRRDRPPFRGERPPREPAPFGIRFLPEHRALGLIARTVQQSRRAMPLRDIVALFFRKPASALVRLEFDDAHKDERFHQCTACGWFARSPEALLAHQISAHFGDRFEAREIEVEPPKGKYATVARCGVTGRLLAPPNDHSYNRRVLEMLRDPACAGLSEAEYRSRIELVSDPEVVEQWRAEQSKKTVFVRRERKPAAPAPAPAADAAPAETDEAAAAAPAPETAPAETAEVAAPAPAAETNPAENAETAAPAPAAEAAEAPAAEETPAQSAEAAEPAAAPAPPPRTYDREEAEALFRAEAAPAMTRVARVVTAPHAVVDRLSDRYVQGEIRRAWERESRSHVPSLFFAVRGGLKACRLALFRASDPARTDFVAPRAPTPLDASTAVPELRAVLDYVTVHPGCTRDEMLAAVVPAGADAAAKDAVLRQFSFAVDRGHLIAYANGTLALPEAHPFYRAEGAAQPAKESHAESAESAEAAPGGASSPSEPPSPAPPAEESYAESAEPPAPSEESHAESAEVVEPAPAEEPHAASAEVAPGGASSPSEPPPPAPPASDPQP